MNASGCDRLHQGRVKRTCDGLVAVDMMGVRECDATRGQPGRVCRSMYGSQWIWFGSTRPHLFQQGLHVVQIHMSVP